MWSTVCFDMQTLMNEKLLRLEVALYLARPTKLLPFVPVTSSSLRRLHVRKHELKCRLHNLIG